MSKADTADWSGTIWIAQRQGLRIVNTFHNNKMRPAVGKKKKGLEIEAAITMPPRLKLSTLDRLALNFCE
jgi:hypothetical protein